MPSRSMAVSSSMAIVEDLLSLAHAISITSESIHSHKKNCRKLGWLIQPLTPLFEEIREGNSPIPPTAIIKFQELRAVFLKSKHVVEQCRDGSRINLLLERENYHHMFRDIADELCSALNGLPLDLLAVSDYFKNQAQFLPSQLDYFKDMEDAQEEQLLSDIIFVLREEEEIESSNHVAGSSVMGKLGLVSIPAIRSEILALEKEKVAGVEVGRPTRDIDVALRLVKRLKLSLGGSDSDDDGLSPLEGTLVAETPNDFKCPISLELMKDPVVLSTGHSYDRRYIESWLDDGHKTCPKTQQVLTQLTMVPNHTLRSLIQQWCDANGVEMSSRPGRGIKAITDYDESGDGDVGDRPAVLSIKDRLQNGNLLDKRSAAEDLRKLAKVSNGNRVCIAEVGTIPILVSLLASGDQKTQEHAVTSLLNLSIHDNNKMLIVSSGAIEPIVHVLEEGNMEARENSAATLYSLSLMDENKISIGQTGAITALVSLLQNGSARGKKDAATALFNLTIYSGNKARAVRAGLVSTVMDILRNPHAGLVDESLAILVNLVTSMEGRTEIGVAAAVPLLVDLIRNGTPRNKEYAASVLLSLCMNGVHYTDAAIELNVMAPLKALLRNGTSRAKRKASQLLQHIKESQTLTAS